MTTKLKKRLLTCKCGPRQFTENHVGETCLTCKEKLEFFNDPEQVKKLVKKPAKATEKQVGGNHYSSMKIQPIQFIVENEIPYREANVIKYVSRHRSKNGKEDIKKAMHYLEMILQEYDRR